MDESKLESEAGSSRGRRDAGRRPSRRAWTPWLLLAALAGPLFPRPVAAQDTWSAPARVVAVGDVHGDFDAFVTVLRDAGLVDEKLKWTGGRAHLVQTGDRLDRGGASRQVMDLLIRLEKEAGKAGGRVHSLTGNHEAMNVLGDLRYVVPEEFAAFKGPDSAVYQAELVEKMVKGRRDRREPPPTEAERQEFLEQHPLGWVEHRLAFTPKGTYWGWIARANAVIKVGDTLFMHGGLSPKYADFSLADLNDRVRRELAEPDRMTAVVSQDPEGPLWYRGLAQGKPDLLPHVEALLVRHGVKRIVVGHTPTEGLVLPRYGGRVVQIDVGLAQAYGGPPAGLVLEEGRAFALHRGRRLPLPETDDEPLLAYVREVVALEPESAKLKALLSRLESAAVPATPVSR